MKRISTALVIMVAGLAVLLSGFESRADDQYTKLLIKKADKLYKKRAKKGKSLKCKEAYEKVLAVDAENIEARWKLGRVLYWLGRHASGKKAQMEYFETGIRYCQEAIKKDPNCVPCQFWLGVSYGKFGEAKGILQSLGLVPHMKSAMEFVLKKNEKYLNGGPHRVLGRLYFKLPAVNGGDNDKAVNHLKRAIEFGPKDMMNHRFLAEVYLATGKKEEAKAILQHIIDFPKEQFDRAIKPETRKEKKEAAKLMKEHFGG